MTSGALLKSAGFFANRANNRRMTNLETVCRDADGQSSPVELLDLSETGFLIRTAEPIAEGPIEICLPDAGIRHARTVWCQNGLLGCEFISPVKRATVSATLLQAPAIGQGSRHAPAGHAPVQALAAATDADGKLHGAARLAIITIAAIVPWMAVVGVIEAVRNAL